MNTHGSLWLPLAILLLLAGISFWIEQSVLLTPSGPNAIQTDPEGIIENFDALRTDPAGNPQYRLSAKRLKHYSGSKLTEMESPRFVQMDAESGDITATAQQATISPDGKEMDLRGEVNVIRAARAGQAAMTLRTARLIVLPDSQLLRAPGAVSVSDTRLNLHAGAMEFHAARHLIKLTGRVKARYISGKI